MGLCGLNHKHNDAVIALRLLRVPLKGSYKGYYMGAIRYYNIGIDDTVVDVGALDIKIGLWAPL